MALKGPSIQYLETKNKSETERDDCNWLEDINIIRTSFLSTICVGGLALEARKRFGSEVFYYKTQYICSDNLKGRLNSKEIDRVEWKK